MSTDWRSHFVRHIDYQVWANQVLFESLAALPAEALDAPQGLFFGSIHHTVDHMLVALRLWAARLHGEHLDADLKAVHHPDWDELACRLQDELREFGRWVGSQSDGFFYRRLSYRRISGAVEENEVCDVLSHLMGHFVHHRGQLSATATRLGAPAPEMDFIYFVRARERAARAAQQQQQQQ